MRGFLRCEGELGLTQTVHSDVVKVLLEVGEDSLEDAVREAVAAQAKDDREVRRDVVGRLRVDCLGARGGSDGAAEEHEETRADAGAGSCAVWQHRVLFPCPRGTMLGEGVRRGKANEGKGERV